MSLPLPAADPFTTCENEPIRFPGAIQPHGALLVAAVASGLIEAASDSCSDLLGHDAASLIGRSLQAVLGPAAVQALCTDTGTPDAQSVALPDFARPLVAMASTNAHQQLLVAIEPGRPHANPQGLLARSMVRAWRRLDDPAAILDAAVQGLRDMTGFDRVMVYRFDGDWNGEVVAEARNDALEPLLGLHYPASDIPRQARELYHLVRVRAIPDVGYAPSTLLAQAPAHDIDLGTCSLRSVSPVHLEYCRNMGVRATLVASLEVDGRLWGLVACHHYAGPRGLEPAERAELAWLCEDLAELLAAALLRQRQARLQALTARRHQLVEHVRAVALQALTQQADAAELLEVVNADGFALVDAQGVRTVGLAPSEDRIGLLMQRRSTLAPPGSAVATHRIEKDLGLPPVGDGIAGVLFVSVLEQPLTSLLWFRKERAETVRWAGDPGRAHELGADGRLSPRKSFSQFLALVRGESLPWSPEENASAAELGALIEIDALRQREALLQTVLDSVPQHLCMLNADGVIVMVNQAWREFALAHGTAESTGTVIGSAYNAVCGQASSAPSGAEAQVAWLGIRSVLTLRQPQFQLEYPRPLADETLWFHLRVVPMQQPCEGAVVIHEDISAHRQAWLAVQAAESRYREMVEAQTESVLRLGADGYVLYVNAAACRFFERPREVLQGLHWQQLTGPVDVSLQDARVRSATPDDPLTSAELRIVLPSGRVRWGHFVHRALFDDQGQLLEAQTVGRDITERKHAEAEVKRLLREQQAILNSPVVGIFKVRHRRISWANAAFAQIHGYALDEVLGRAPRLFVPNDEALATLVQAAAPALSTGQIYRTELQHRCKDGRLIWVELSVAMLDEEQDETIGALVDISHLKAAEAGLQEHQLALEGMVASRTRALAQARDEAQAANRAKSVFLTTMSHELRTPMNAIMGLTQLARKNATDAKQADQLGKALNAATGLLAIINDILDLSRVETGNVVPEHLAFDLDGVFDKLKTLSRDQAAKAGLDLVLQLDPALRGRRLMGDAQRLGQVLLNLVANAIKFTSQGAVRARALQLEAQARRSHVRFEVQDTGIGIAAEDQVRIFKAFEQVDGSTTRLYGGSGLGLSICRRLVELMGGEIGVSSELGVGSTFWVSLWLDRADAVASQSKSEPDNPDERAIRERHRDARVLVVDDEPLNREVMRVLLEECQLHVDEAVDGQQAVELAAQQPYALILMDMQMPKLDGCAATRQIRASGRGSRVPIIAMTANVFQEDEEACRTAGMDDFLGKPIQTERLFSMALRWLDRPGR